MTSRLRRLPWADLVLAAAVLSAGAFLALRDVPRQTTEWPYLRADQLRIYGAVCAALLLILLVGRALPRPVRFVTRGVVAVASAFLVAMSVGRAMQKPDWWWPPIVNRTPYERMATLTPVQSAEWAARVAMHRVSELKTDEAFTVPASWPFPDSVALVVERGARDSARVWARANDGTVRCAERPQIAMNHLPRRGEDPSTEFTPCAGRVAPAADRFVLPARGAEVSAGVAASMEAAAPDGDTIADSLESWSQYRHDAEHDGVLTAAEHAGRFTWHGKVSGEVRSTPSVAAGVLIVGSHGAGTLAAFDAHTGEKLWSHRLPNWIHQDAVSNGEFVVVGFGDNHASFTGRLPAGVAAYSLHTGVRAWTVFDESSIMTSPVIVDSTIVYASASGRLRRRDLATGALLDERRLPGGVIMAPPALVGDTLVVALDVATVCAVHVRTFGTLWCREFPKAFMMGHYALTVSGGVVYAASSQVLQALTLREVLQTPADRWPYVVEALVSPRFFAAGQRLYALSLHDGTVRWQSGIRVATRDVGGHPAGTAVVSGRYGAIMYPAQDSLVGFDVVSGAVRWTLSGRGTRGPLLLHDGLVIHAGRDGGIESRDIATGALRCRVKLGVGFDRAGPTIAGDALYVADVEGGVHAIPAALVTRCGSPRYSDAPHPKRTKTDG